MRVTTRPIPFLPIAVLVGLILSVILPAPEAIPKGTLQRALVINVVDGDTFDVDLDGDGAIDTRVRMLGIDAPEMGDCGSRAAKRALTRLIGGKRVELRSDENLKGRFGRILRRVMVRRDGTLIDVTRWMLRRGHGVWMPHKTEVSRALSYHRASARAAARGLRYFDPVRCRRGPRQRVPLRIDVQWRADTAPGVDPLREEFVRITNTGTAGIDVDRWAIRTGNIRRLRIPRGKPIAAGRTLTIHTGSGKNRRYHRFLGLSGPWLPDTDLDVPDPHVGNGVYLLDRDGDMRAYQMWPCVVGCEDPTAGSLVIEKVNYDPPGPDAENLNGEWVRLTNVGTEPVLTGRLVVELRPRFYELPPRHRLLAGASLVIHSGRGNDSRGVRYVGSDKPLLHNDGHRVVVRTYSAIVIDCVAWGDKSCPDTS